MITVKFHLWNQPDLVCLCVFWPNIVAVTKDHVNENKWGYVLTLLWWGGSPLTCMLERFKADKGGGSSIMKEGLRRAQVHPERGLWAWGSSGQLAGGAATHLVGYGSILDFLWLVLSRKWRQKLGKLAGIGQVLAVWGWLSSVGISSSCVCVRARTCAFSVVSDSLWPPRLWPSRLLCPWNSPGKNIRVGCHFFLQVIFPTQGSNLRLLRLFHW